MRIICINNAEKKYNLIVGNNYNINKIENNFYWVKNSTGKIRKYHKKYFELIEELIVTVVPPPPLPDKFTEQEILDSIEFDLNSFLLILDNEEFSGILYKTTFNVNSTLFYKYDFNSIGILITNIQKVINEAAKIYPFVIKYNNKIIDTIIVKAFEELIKRNIFLIITVEHNNNNLFSKNFMILLDKIEANNKQITHITEDLVYNPYSLYTFIR